MTCKDCVHDEVCEEYGEVFSLIKGGKCSLFKDRSRFVELPCKLGDTVYYFNSAGEIYSQKVSGFIVNFVGILVDSDVMFDSHLMGDRFFSTREEAEQALKSVKTMPTELTPRDLWLINCYEREQLESDDVYVFTIKLCDNDVDRDGERFTLKSLNILKDMFVGQAGIVDHSPKNKNVTARILECDVRQTLTRTTATGECYYYLTARAYIKRSAESEKIISSIESGELSEVSVGCAVSATVCNICGEEIQVCPHTKGNYYNGQLCCGELISPYEAYEWSFVAKPKALSESKPITPEAAIIRLNQIRTATGERPPEIDMAIRAINLNMVRRIPIENSKSEWCCPSCNYPIDYDFCAHCGQALDWND